MADNYPVSSYYFKVLIGGTEFAFKEVSGIKATMEYKQEQRQGGDTSSQHKVFDKFSFSNVKFSKGLVSGESMAKNALETIFKIKFDSNPNSVSIDYQTVIITLMDEKNSPALVMGLEGAYPISWEISTFDAMSKELAIESLELNYQKLSVQ